MQLPLFRQKKHRGKGKSPEQRFKEKKAKVDAFLLDSWLKQLKDDPSLAARIAEQKYGSEAVIAYGQDGEYSERPDLLEVLRQAKEAKDLIRDELGESKGSTIKGIAEIMRALPSALQALGQANLNQFQRPNPQTLPQRQFHQIPKPEPKAEQAGFGEVRLDRLMALLELEPEQAWETLKADGEAGWQDYLRETSYEQLEQHLRVVGEANPELQPHIESFLKQKHGWLEQLVEIAHRSEAK